ncbi:MFS transporter [bacterium]|nr:MAG: MFS transporter [bacterium]
MLTKDTPTISRPQPGQTEQIATRVAFFIAGVGMAAWAPLVPYAKARMGLDEGTLGFLLLFLGFGSICTMPLTGTLAGRFGCRAVLTVASVLIGVALPLLAYAPNPVALALALFLFGASVGSVDVAVNIQAVIVEKASGRSMMSGFHGLFSLGGFIGAGGVSGLLTLGLPPLFAMLCVSVLIVLLIGVFAKGMLDYGSESREPLFVVPRGRVVFIGVLCFIVFLAEGSMLDWSAVFLSSRRALLESQAGIGYAAFATAMTLGRLTGDRIVQALGNFRVLLGGALCAASGFMLAVLVPHPVAAVLGFTLVGMGASNIVPVLYTALGQQKVMPVGLAISSVTTIGYTGILTGPALIGFIARLSSLEISFGLIALMLLGVAASAKAVTR